MGDIQIFESNNHNDLSIKRETVIVQGLTPHSVALFMWLDYLKSEYNFLEVRGCKIQKKEVSINSELIADLDFECMLSWYYLYEPV